MSIFIDGMTCRLCGQPMTSDQGLRQFLPFVVNELDEIRFFNDGVFHKACLAQHPLSSIAIRLNEQAIENGKPYKRRSFISGKQIVDYSDYLPMGLLTSDVENPLYEFNFAHFSKAELCSWDRLEELIALLLRQEDDGKLGGKGVSWLISELSKAHRPRGVSP